MKMYRFLLRFHCIHGGLDRGDIVLLLDYCWNDDDDEVDYDKLLFLSRISLVSISDSMEWIESLFNFLRL